MEKNLYQVIDVKKVVVILIKKSAPMPVTALRTADSQGCSALENANVTAVMATAPQINNKIAILFSYARTVSLSLFSACASCLMLPIR